MKHTLIVGAILAMIALMLGCTTAYEARPLAFKTPAAYNNTVEAFGAQIGGRAFVDSSEATNSFGFDIRGAGMLPVQVVFDNLGGEFIVINPGQTFLEDNDGNLWPILSDRFAYERATKYAQTKEIFKEGAYGAFLGAAAGSVIGAAIGIVSGRDVGSAIGKGAAVGAAGGAVLGGASGATENEARTVVTRDLREKSLENKAVKPGDLAHGIIFFPGEAKSAKQLRLQLKVKDTERVQTVLLKFNGSPAVK
jgi:hypothetical protein